ncbi:phage recombination protein Bet [Macrococcus sp. S115]|uniref:phage recombination protein Bet n=1 Tax=Macrococcus sp. S115 TaxID=3047480 RepID=UPI0024BC4A6E|nr:phage recombination protein Bet [Macrococcus sp. S115]MDJ1110661.1 phage recombination protein Bet [Macrococcus sp. S115]
MTNNTLLTKSVEYEVNGKPVRLSGEMIKQYLIRGGAEVSDQEVLMFLQLCQFQELNPWLNEAYLIKFKGAPAQIIVSKEAFMKRAESHEQYNGLEAGIIVERDGQMVELEGAVSLKNDVLLGGWAKVYRKDRERPVVIKISMQEFSKGQSTWKQMPNNMIRKTAIVNALREAFPEKLNQMYTEEEAPSEPQVNVQEEIKQKANQTLIDIPTVEQAPDLNQQKPRQEPEPVVINQGLPVQAEDTLFEESLF